jgi:esterase/lipase
LNESSNGVGVLFIHGFLGSPLEWQSLQRILEQGGYGTHAITHVGHNTQTKEKLNAFKAEQILTHCLTEYSVFSKRFHRVYIIGHSLGGLSALWIAGQNPEKLAGVLAFSTPYRHAYWVNYIHGLLRYPLRNIQLGLQYAPDYFTGHMKPKFSLGWLPYLQKETTRTFSETAKILPDIEVPVWLAHSPYDLAVPYGEMALIAKRINRPELVSMHTLSRCGHQVFQNRRVYAEPSELACRFLSELEELKRLSGGY